MQRALWLGGLLTLLCTGCSSPSSGRSTLGGSDAAATDASASARRPIVRTEEGDVQGSRDPATFVFRGIPYAAPPVGPLRWRATQPPPKRSATLDAEYFGLACVQPPGLSEANGGDPGRTGEDCLTLNIWTPRMDSAAKLPVFVWIHGGAFTFGSGSLDIYSGSSLASRGAVVITINYRLGQLGFFAHPALEREDPGGPANFGLLDQIQALTWIQKNVGAFGGDPGNVTIAGQSAGARSVLALMASPLARGLFQRAIAQSSYAIPDVTRIEASALGIAVTRAAGLNGAAATTDELRAIPAERLALAVGRSVSVSPVLIRGDAALPRTAQDVFSAQQEAPVPLVVGSTSDDGSVVSGFGYDYAELVRRLGALRFPLRVLYPNVRDDSELGRLSIRDVIFTMNARWIADRHSRQAPTWRYYFDYSASGLNIPDFKGVVHGGEVVFTLDSHEAMSSPSRFTEADRAFSKLVGDYWFEFAKSGRPQPAGAPEWLDHRIGQDSTMVFGVPPAATRDFMRRPLDLYIASVSALDRLFAGRTLVRAR